MPTVITVAAVAINKVAPRGVVARATALSSRRSNLDSFATLSGFAFTSCLSCAPAMDYAAFVRLPYGSRLGQVLKLSPSRAGCVVGMNGGEGGIDRTGGVVPRARPDLNPRPTGINHLNRVKWRPGRCDLLVVDWSSWTDSRSRRPARARPSATGVAALLALLSAVCFALSAALQQRGQFSLARSGAAVEGVTGLLRLIAVPVWLLGTLILFLAT